MSEMYTQLKTKEKDKYRKLKTVWDNRLNFIQLNKIEGNDVHHSVKAFIQNIYNTEFIVCIHDFRDEIYKNIFKNNPEYEKYNIRHGCIAFNIIINKEVLFFDQEYKFVQVLRDYFNDYKKNTRKEKLNKLNDKKRTY